MYATILQYLEVSARKFQNKPAFSDIHESYSFREVEVYAKKIGCTVAKQVKPHNPVVVYMDKGAYNIISFMGVVYAGCFYVPIDSQMPQERIQMILDRLHPGLILYDDVTNEKIKKIDEKIKKIHYKDALKAMINNEILADIRSHVKNTDLLYVLFTSGSTGEPKGVTISHAAVIDLIEWICDAYGLDQTTKLCNQAPFYFDASVPDLYIPLKTGATVYIPPKIYYTFPKKVLQFIKENEINTLIWVPSALCNIVNFRALELCVPQSIKLVIFCGEVMPCRHLNIWKRYIPDALYVNMYGPTEATYACMYYNIERKFDDNEKLPLGRACENSEILLFDNENRVVTDGEVGEICILGQCLSQGYYNAPEKTAEVFVQNPLNSKWIEYMYKTGDLAYKNKKGEMVFVGRKDNQIKRLGHRIELGDIENSVLSISGVDNGCCLFDDKEEKIILVYAGCLEENVLNKILSEKLPNYMLPNIVIKLFTMPLNLNGKIDRQELKKIYIKDNR